MQTLVYLDGQFNRPDTLLPFLQSNVGNSPLIQIDCLTPFQGTAKDLIDELCEYLNGLDSSIEVLPCCIQNQTSKSSNEIIFVNYLVLQITIKNK